MLEEISGGAVSKTDGDFVGSEANYSCNYGYGMVGGPTLTCMSSGESNGSPPECYSELHVYKQKSIFIVIPRIDHVPSS